MKLPRELREFVRYASLNVLGMAGLSCYILADTYFISKGMGSDGLAALNLALPVYSFIHGTGLLFGMGGATRFSILKNQGRTEEGQAAFTHALVIGELQAALFFLLGVFGSDTLAYMLGGRGEVYEMSRTYLQMLLLFSPAVILNDVISCFVRNDGAPHLAAAGLLTGCIANIILDYVFIFPMQMGIFGAVLATEIAPVLSLCVMSPFFFRKKNSFHLCRCALKGRLTADIAGAGLPSLVTEVSSGIVIMVFNAILLRMEGETAVAAYGVVTNLALVATAIYTGLAQGVQPLMSGYYGRGENESVRRLLGYGLKLSLTMAGAIYAAILLWAQPIAGVFNSAGESRLQELAVWGLKVYFLYGFFAGVNILLATFFTCVERPRPANIMSLLRGLLLVVPMAFLLSAAGGMTGLWAAVAVTEALVTGLGLRFYFKKNEKTV